MLCFIAGQLMVAVHQHKVLRNRNLTYQTASNQNKTTLKEKCEFCDAMHHNHMLMESTTWFCPLVATSYHYVDVSYNFISMSLVLSAGRSPPLS